MKQIQKLGIANRESGHIQAIQKIAASIGGQTIAAINVKSGRWDEVRKMGLSIGGKTQTHLRWHVARDIYQPNCEICRKQQDSVEDAKEK